VPDEVHLHTMRSSASGFSSTVSNLCRISMSYSIRTGSVLAPCMSWIHAHWSRPDSTERVFCLCLGTAAVRSGASWAMEHLSSHMSVQKRSRRPLPSTVPPTWMLRRTQRNLCVILAASTVPHHIYTMETT
jgi:hypothetical protein